MSDIRQRAAKYFGAADRPRTTIKVNRYKVLLLVPHNKSMTVGIYSEEGAKPSGKYAYLDGAKPELLRRAVSEPVPSGGGS